MKRRRFHPTSLALLATFAGCVTLAAFQNVTADQPSVFTILSRGQIIGTESVTVTHSAAGELISATGSLGPPFDLTTNRFQLRYDVNGAPQSLSMEGSQANQRILLTATFSGGTAHAEGLLRGQPVDTTHQISPRSIVLPNDHYAAYEALAERLGTATVGTQFQLYVLAAGEVGATVDAIIPHHLITPGGPVDLRQFDLTIANRVPLPIEVWIDSRGRLARLAVPSSWLVVIRDDISSVMTREETITRAGDQEAFIPALGFELAATLSKPNTQAARAPAVVLVGAPGRQDRDEPTGGVPVFGHLAAALADRGYLVVRYDQRGISRSGGRVESASLDEYADDALSVVKWLRNRRDIDPDRIALAGYGQGGAVALMAAAREKHVAAVVLIGAAGQTGRDVTLQQQQHLLGRSKDADAAKRAKVDLQLRILDAVIKGTGWETLPPEVRTQADSTSFKSWLLFDPAKLVPKLKQPLLILTGALDTEFPPAQADRLEALGRARKKIGERDTRKVIVPGVNHLLVPSTTGEQDEYASLSGATIAPAAADAIGAFLSTVMPPRK